jgi:arsenite-transporting ATPase
LRQLLDVAPPDIDEVIAMADVATAVTASRASYDTIVADTAPTGHALRLLQTPAVLRQWVQALIAILLKYREVVQAGALGHLLVDWSQRLRTLMGLLHDPRQTQLVLVTRAAALPIAESLRFSRELKSLRISVGAVVVNATGGGACRGCRARAKVENAQVARLLRTNRRDTRNVIATAAMMPPPHGVRVLAEWSARWMQLG